MMADDGNSSSTNNCSSSGAPLISCLDPWYIVAGVVIAVICLLGIPANIVVIVKLSRHLRGSCMSQRLFFNLAVSDLLCLLCLPIGLVIFFYGSHLTREVCQLLFYFFFFCIAADLNILVLISIQRYYQVLHSEKWDKVARTWQRFFLFTVWMLAALVALPVVFLLIEVQTQKLWTVGRTCRNLRISPVLEVVYILFVAFSHLVSWFFYLLLVRGLKRNLMPGKKKPRVTQLFTRIIAVTLVVGVFPLVFRGVYVAALFLASDELLHLSQMLTFVECFYFFHHCLNPFLYFFASWDQSKERKSKRRCFLMPLDDNS